LATERTTLDPLDEALLVEGIEMIAPHRHNRKKVKTQDGRKLLGAISGAGRWSDFSPGVRELPSLGGSLRAASGELLGLSEPNKTVDRVT
jgi:hypothetical protein